MGTGAVGTGAVGVGPGLEPQGRFSTWPTCQAICMEHVADEFFTSICRGMLGKASARAISAQVAARL